VSDDRLPSCQVWEAVISAVQRSGCRGPAAWGVAVAAAKRCRVQASEDTVTRPLPLGAETPLARTRRRRAALARSTQEVLHDPDERVGRKEASMTVGELRALVSTSREWR
jgi:hypothetical protein